MNATMLHTIFDCNFFLTWSLVALFATIFTVFYLTMTYVLDYYKRQEKQEEAGVIKLFLRSFFMTLPPFETANLLVAIMHAMIATMFGLSALIKELRPCGQPLGTLQKLTLQFSLGYFIYDFFFLLRTSSSLDMILHHIISFVSLSWGLLFNISGTELSGSIFLTELSTPLLHIRTLIRCHRNTSVGKKIYDFLGLLFSIIFIISRIFTLGPLITYLTLISTTSPIAVKLGGTSLYVVSLLWGVKILYVLIVKIKKKEFFYQCTVDDANKKQMLCNDKEKISNDFQSNH